MSLFASVDPGKNFNGKSSYSWHCCENCLKNLLNTSLPGLGEQLRPENHLNLLWNRSSQYLGTDLVSANMSWEINLTFVVSVAPQQEQDNDENCDRQSCSHSNYHEFMTIRS